MAIIRKSRLAWGLVFSIAAIFLVPQLVELVRPPSALAQLPGYPANYELLCPAGSVPLAGPTGTSFNITTGKYRANFCSDPFGNISQNISGAISVANIGGAIYCDGVTNATLAAAVAATPAGGTVVIPASGCPSATSTINRSTPINFIFQGSFSSSANPIFAFTGVGGITMTGGGNGSTAASATTITQTTTGGKIMTIGDGTNPFRGMVVQNLRFVATTPSATSTIKLNANLGSIKFRDLFGSGISFDGTAGNYAIIIHDNVRLDSAVTTSYNYNCGTPCAGIHFWGTYANGTSGGIGYDLSNCTASFVSTHGDSNTSAYRLAGAIRMYGSDSESNSVAGINIVGSGNYEIVGHHSGADQLPVQINAAGANVTITDLSSTGTVGASSIAVSGTSNGDNKLFSTAGLDKQVSVTAGGILQIYNNNGITGFSPFTFSGTGACLTNSSSVGNSWSGQVTCSGTTGAATLTITPGTTAHAWNCYGSDITAAHQLTGIQSSSSTTTCTLSFTSVTSGDIVTISTQAY